MVGAADVGATNWSCQPRGREHSVWSSQGFVDTSSPPFLNCFKLLWAHAAYVTVTAGSVVEADVIRHFPDDRAEARLKALVVPVGLGRQAISGSLQLESGPEDCRRSAPCPFHGQRAVVGPAADARRPSTGSDEWPRRVNIAPRRAAAAWRCGRAGGQTARGAQRLPPSGRRGSGRARSPIPPHCGFARESPPGFSRASRLASVDT